MTPHPRGVAARRNPIVRCSSGAGAGPGIAQMALIKCKECGKDISSDVKACPHCGKKRGMGLLGKLILYPFLGFVGLMVLVSVVGGGSKGSGSAGGSSAAAPPPPPAEPAIEVTATQLHKAYHANEVAADAQYKDKHVLVTGTVEGIKKDAFGSPYLSIESGQMFMNLHCTFSRDSAGQLAQVSKGSSVKLAGRVSGMVVGSVMVKDCQLQ
jgi:hypothetical protein